MIVRIALAALAVVLLAAAPAGASAPRSFFGVQPWSSVDAGSVRAAGGAGAGVLRVNAAWHVVEQVPGRYDWQALDEAVGAAAEARMRVLPVLVGTPRHLASSPGRPPRTAAARRSFAAFSKAAVRRYGPRGAFWRERPGLPRIPVRDWQVWNEPNLDAYSGGRPDPRAYGRLLVTGATAIRSADPQARIVAAGLPESRRGMRMLPYLRRLYAVGAARHADVIALHVYTSTPAGLRSAVVQARRIMDAAGDRRTPIWITEIGAGTAGPAGPLTTSEAGQARRLADAFRTLLGLRRSHRVIGAVWFSLRDRPLEAGERDWWAPHTGLLRLDGRPKPALDALRRVARR